MRETLSDLVVVVLLVVLCLLSWRLIDRIERIEAALLVNRMALVEALQEVGGPEATRDAQAVIDSLGGGR